MITYICSGLDAGGARVDHLFKEYLCSIFAADGGIVLKEISRLVSDGLRDFQSSAKRRFSDAAVGYKVQVGSRRMNNEPLQIAKGVMTLKGCASSFNEERSITP